MSEIDLGSRRVALIGGAGFIGHHLALSLQALGAHVEIVDGLQVNNLVALTANKERLPHRDLYLHLINERLQLLNDASVPVHVQDARDYHALSQMLSAIKPDIIVHLAAVAHAGWANKNPYTTFDHSLRTLENALDWSRDNAEHFVYFSSSMVYGNFKGGSVDESTHCEPLGIYGALKFAGEKMVIAYNQVFDLPYTIVRPSALYGERCVSRRVIQVFIENAFRGQPLSVSGSGAERLDFTYVGDLVHGLIQVMRDPKAKNEIFNLTFGQGRSIKELIGLLEQHFPDLDVEYQPGDHLVPERGTLSVDKAKRLIDYTPSYPLERGVDEYVSWYRKVFENHPSLTTAP